MGKGGASSRPCIKGVRLASREPSWAMWRAEEAEQGEGGLSGGLCGMNESMQSSPIMLPPPQVTALATRYSLRDPPLPPPRVRILPQAPHPLGRTIPFSCLSRPP